MPVDTERVTASKKRKGFRTEWLLLCKILVRLIGMSEHLVIFIELCDFPFVEVSSRQ